MHDRLYEPRRPAARGADGCNGEARRAGHWLALAATPTFAFMALLTGVLEAAPGALCLGADASPLGGMPLMYILMSAFHLAPWLRLIAVRRHAAAGQSPLDVGPSPAQPS